MTSAAKGIPEGASAENQFWGDRIGWVMDPSGHVWTIATRVEETTEEERQARLSQILASWKE